MNDAESLNRKSKCLEHLVIKLSLANSVVFPQSQTNMDLAKLLNRRKMPVMKKPANPKKVMKKPVMKKPAKSAANPSKKGARSRSHGGPVVQIDSDESFFTFVPLVPTWNGSFNNSIQSFESSTI